MTDRLVALLASIALSAPVPAMAQGRNIMVGTCLGGTSRIEIPADPGQPSGHDCCGKACHAASDRRKKTKQSARDCC